MLIVNVIEYSNNTNIGNGVDYPELQPWSDFECPIVDYMSKHAVSSTGSLPGRNS